MSATLRLPPVNLDGLAELVRVVEGAGLPGDDARQPEWRFFRAAPDGAGTWYGEPEGDGPALLLRSVAVPPELQPCWSLPGRCVGAGIQRSLARHRPAASADHDDRPHPFAGHPAWSRP